MYLRHFTIICILMLGFPTVSAEYYANVNIDVSDNGEVEITGLTNHPGLQSIKTQEYTSKKKSNWVLDIDLEGVFSDYIFEIKFPENAAINYLKIPDLLSMEEESGRLVVIGTGTNQKFHIIAQYNISMTKQYKGRLVIVLLTLLSLAIILFYLYSYIKKPKPNFKSLTSRQKKIMDLVIKNKGSITQSKLNNLIKIPKASLSRNIDSLVRKKMLVKESKGMTNIIYIKKE